MDTYMIDEKLATAARLLRDKVAQRVADWQKIPYLSLEANGRGGWSDSAAFPYKYGLWIADTQWPPRVYIECSSGRLVEQRSDELHDAEERDILACYLTNPGAFDAHSVIAQLVQLAARDDSYNKECNDAAREHARRRFDIVENHTRPAVPVKWGYSD